MLCSRPVSRSLADTCTIPFASISKVTSICGTPAGALLIPLRRKVPRSLLSLANCRSPCKTLISTLVCPLIAVENTWLFLHGIVEFFSIRCVAIPPTVSIESVRGVTSSKRSSDALPESPASLPPCIDAPSATHSSGFIFLLGSSPVSCFTLS